MAIHENSLSSEYVLIGEPSALLASRMGQKAAREVFQQSLRNGEIEATADHFVSSGPRRHAGMGSNYSSPEQAADYKLPSEFWNTDFATDGEREVRAGSVSEVVFADWTAGNFTYRHRTPDHLSFRSASGVRVNRAATVAVLSRYSIDGGGVSGVNAPTIPTAPASRKPGRPPGSALSEKDGPLIAQGAELVRTGRASSAHNAAVQLAPNAPGPATESTKVRRLAPKIKNALESANNSAGN